jgi:hypothetical protein
VQLLTAAIKVIHRIDNVLAFGHEAHKYEADGCTQIGRHYWCAANQCRTDARCSIAASESSGIILVYRR